jgi:hypothetical protein
MKAMASTTNIRLEMTVSGGRDQRPLRHSPVLMRDRAHGPMRSHSEASKKSGAAMPRA